MFSENCHPIFFFAGCFCLNGPLQLANAMVFTFVGFMFSLATLGDCAFAEIRLPSDDPIYDQIGDGETPAPGEVYSSIHRVGLITFENPNGSCYWYNEGFNPEDQIQAYFDWLGSDWAVARGFVAFVCVCSFFVWLYSWWFTCTAQVKAVRYTLACIVTVALTVFQCLSFLALGSNSFCDKYLCTFGRSAGFSIGAAICYFIAGILLFFSSDYPGKARLEAMKGGDENAAVAAAVVPPSKKDDPEQPEMPENPDEPSPSVGPTGENDEEPEMDIELGKSGDPTKPDPLDEEDEEAMAAAAVAAGVDGEEGEPVEAEAELVDDEAAAEGDEVADESEIEKNEEFASARSEEVESTPEEAAGEEAAAEEAEPATAEAEEAGGEEAIAPTDEGAAGEEVEVVAPASTTNSLGAAEVQQDDVVVTDNTPAAAEETAAQLTAPPATSGTSAAQTSGFFTLDNASGSKTS